MRLLGNMVARGEDKFGPDALSGSEDGRHVAFVGPSEFAVTVVDGKNLNEVSYIFQYFFICLIFAVKYCGCYETLKE